MISSDLKDCSFSSFDERHYLWLPNRNAKHESSLIVLFCTLFCNTSSFTIPCKRPSISEDQEYCMTSQTDITKSRWCDNSYLARIDTHRIISVPQTPAAVSGGGLNRMDVGGFALWRGFSAWVFVTGILKFYKPTDIICNLKNCYDAWDMQHLDGRRLHSYPDNAGFKNIDRKMRCHSTRLI